MTLKEVKRAVAAAKLSKRVPSPQMLETDSKVFVQKEISGDSMISVYENGFVLYQAGDRKAVFPIHGCGSYCYEAVTGTDVIEGSYFEEQVWYVRLLMEGEDLLDRNQVKRASNYKQVSYSDFLEDREWFSDTTQNLEIDLIRRETFAEIDSLLDERQRFAFYSYYVDQLTQREIAEQLGLKSQQMVSHILKMSIFKLRKHMDPEWISRLLNA